MLGSANTGPRQNCAGLPGTPSYPEVAATPGTFGKGDLYFVKTRNTPSGNVEVHSATRTSDYQSADLAVATVFTAADGPNGTWQMANLNHDGYVDLVFIKTNATGSGKVEVFAAFGGADHFQNISLAKASLFNQNENTHGWFQIQNADLTYIKTHATGSGMIEYFRATIGSDYQTRVEATPTLFSSAEAGLGSFSTIDTNGDSGADLVYVKTRATSTGKIEIFAATSTTTNDEPDPGLGAPRLIGARRVRDRSARRVGSAGRRGAVR